MQIKIEFLIIFNAFSLEPVIQIRLSIDYDYLLDIATLRFHENNARNFHLKSIELTYKFDGLVLSDGILDCIVSSKVYKFSTRLFKRHPFHNEYNCKTIVTNENDGLTYSMEFLLTIPYFQYKTEIKFKPLGSYFAPDNIVKIFNNNFIADEKLTKAEKIDLHDLQ